MNIMKKITSNLVIIVVSCIIVLLVGLLTIYNTIFNKDYFKKILEENDYYTKTEEKIKDDFSSYAPQLHIGDETTDLSDIYTKKMIKEDIDNVIDSIYDNKKIEVNTDKIVENIDKKVNNMLEKYNKKPTQEEEKSLNEWKTNIANSYKEEIIYIEKYINKLPKYYNKAKNLFPIIIRITELVGSIFLLLLVILQKNIKDILKNIGVSLLTSSFILIIIRILYKDRISHILVLSERVSEVAVNILKNMMDISTAIGIILGIIGLIGIIIGVGSTKPSEK